MPSNSKPRKKKPMTAPQRHEINRTECWEYLDDQRITLLQTVASYRDLMALGLNKDVQAAMDAQTRQHSMDLVQDGLTRLDEVVRTTNHLYSQHQGKTGDALRTNQIEFLQLSEDYMVVNAAMIDICNEVITPLKDLVESLPVKGVQ